MDSETLISILEFSNEILSAAIVIVSFSLLLYNLARNLNDRVNRASGIVLGCITIAYLTDSAISLEPNLTSLELWYRVQWVGIAFIPAAMFHLADALVATTGLVSRWRRRTVSRILYTLSTVLLLLAIFDDSLVGQLRTEPITHLEPKPLFFLYTAYFVVATLVSMGQVWRARNRSLTSNTRKRMTYLFLVYPLPGLGIFPYTVLFANFSSGIPSVPTYIAFNIANLMVVLTLLFMAYPLSFFGTTKPDRIIKTELLHFVLRGPMIAILLLSVMVFVPRLSNVLGLPGESFVIIAVVGTVLFSEWVIEMTLPRLEDLLIYNRRQEDGKLLRQLGNHMLTRADTNQLQETILAAACNQLRVPTAFLATFSAGGIKTERTIGEIDAADVPNAILRVVGLPPGSKLAAFYDKITQHQARIMGEDYWLFVLYEVSSPEIPLGVMGFQARKTPLTAEEEIVMDALTERASRIVTDTFLQGQIIEPLSELVTDLGNVRARTDLNQFGYYFYNPNGHHPSVEVADSGQFNEWVHDALRNLWGGTKLADNPLVNLRIVQDERSQSGESELRALQNIITQALDTLKPDGDRSLTNIEWRVYNILEMRFLQGKKVREVARKLAMSEPDFYRKQKLAIEEIGQRLREMESSYAADMPQSGR